VNAHRQLPAWQLARELVSAVYRIAASLPPDERLIAIPHLKRAAWSVQNHIAEGSATRGRSERHRVFGVALVSLAEVDSMVSTLARIYAVDRAQRARVARLRRCIRAGLVALIGSGGR
jgi:four helix bundle protein